MLPRGLVIYWGTCSVGVGVGRLSVVHHFSWGGKDCCVSSRRGHLSTPPRNPPQSEGHLGPTLSPLASLVHPLTLTGSCDHVSRLLLATQRQSSLKR